MLYHDLTSRVRQPVPSCETVHVIEELSSYSCSWVNYVGPRSA
jgi:hypothetical protein